MRFRSPQHVISIHQYTTIILSLLAISTTLMNLETYLHESNIILTQQNQTLSEILEVIKENNQIIEEVTEPEFLKDTFRYILDSYLDATLFQQATEDSLFSKFSALLSTAKDLQSFIKKKEEEDGSPLAIIKLLNDLIEIQEYSYAALYDIDGAIHHPDDDLPESSDLVPISPPYDEEVGIPDPLETIITHFQEPDYLSHQIVITTAKVLIKSTGIYNPCCSTCFTKEFITLSPTIQPVYMDVLNSSTVLTADDSVITIDKYRNCDGNDFGSGPFSLHNTYFDNIWEVEPQNYIIRTNTFDPQTVIPIRDFLADRMDLHYDYVLEFAPGYAPHLPYMFREAYLIGNQQIPNDDYCTPSAMRQYNLATYMYAVTRMDNDQQCRLDFYTCAEKEQYHLGHLYYEPTQNCNYYQPVILFSPILVRGRPEKSFMCGVNFDDTYDPDHENNKGPCVSHDVRSILSILNIRGGNGVVPISVAKGTGRSSNLDLQIGLFLSQNDSSSFTVELPIPIQEFVNVTLSESTTPVDATAGVLSVPLKNYDRSQQHNK